MHLVLASSDKTGNSIETCDTFWSEFNDFKSEKYTAKMKCAHMRTYVLKRLIIGG
jgi:hypothetical protein